MTTERVKLISEVSIAGWPEYIAVVLTSQREFRAKCMYQYFTTNRCTFTGPVESQLFIIIENPIRAARSVAVTDRKRPITPFGITPIGHGRISASL